MAERQGHVSIDGSSYKIDLGSYRVRDLSDFSPRSSTPGGGIIFSEMALYQPLNQTDWRHGYGFHWHEDAAGYQETVGNIDTRNAGIAMLYTKPTARLSTVQALYGGFTPTHSSLYLLAWSPNVGGDTQKYTISSGTFAAITALAGTPMNAIWTNGTYTFVCPVSGRIKKSNAADLETWSDTGAGANSTNYSWLTGHDGFVYAGKTLTNQVYYASAVDLSDLEGDPTDDPTVIYVGPAGRRVISAVSFAGDLFFTREDGLFKMDKDRSAARRVLDYSDQINVNNFKSIVVYNGSLYFPIRNQIYQWNGSRVAPVTPPRLNDAYPYVTYTDFDNFCVIGNYLVMTARTSNSASYTDLLCFDGVGWHKIYRFSSTAADRITAMTFISGLWTNDWLWFNHQSVTSGVPGIYNIPFNASDEFPYPSFPTTGTHSLITSKFDAGFRRIIKSSPSILMEASNLASGRYLKLYYRINTEQSWTAWGGTDGTTNLITTDGVTELTSPTTSGTVEYYWIQFRVDFITGDAAQTPVLEGLTLRLLMRPETSYGYSFDILVEQDYEFGVHSELDRDPKSMLTALHAARDSKAPITFIDIFDISHKVYVTAISELSTEWRPEEVGASQMIDHRVSVNLIDTASN